MKIKKTYIPKITIKKFALATVEIFLIGAIIYLTDNQFWLGLVPVLVGIKNILKNGVDFS